MASQQIADFLQRHPDPNLTTIDIVAHGQDGMLFLGNAVLDNDTVGQYAAQLKTIGAALQPGGDLMLYGCDVAADPDGVILLAQITKRPASMSPHRPDRSAAPPRAALGR